MASTLIDRLDGLSSSAAIKGPCRVATTANIALYGLQTIDGVALADDDRVLVKDQSAGYENGIFVADTGQWRRSKDFNKTRDVVKGTTVLVTDGTVNAGLEFQVTSANPVVVGTSSIGFSPTLGGTALQPMTGRNRVATWALIASTVIPATVATFATDGYSALHDGSGAEYRIAADDTEYNSYPAACRATSSNGRKFVLDPKYYVTPMMCGALGVDDTQPIRDAITVATLRTLEVRGFKKTFLISDYLGNFSSSVTMIGGMIKRIGQTTGQAMAAFSGPEVILKDVTWDGNKASVSAPCNLVYVVTGCSVSFLDGCKFINAKASGGYGGGLIYDINVDATHDHRIRGGYAKNCDENGASINACGNLKIEGFSGYDNAGHGLWVSNNSGSGTKKIYNFQQFGGHFERNGKSGCVNGSLMQASGLFGYDDPKTINVVIQGVMAVGNADYGIAASGKGVLVRGCTARDNGMISATFHAGFLFNCYGSRLEGCISEGNYAWGIDAGGSMKSSVCNNTISLNGITEGHEGINLGAVQSMDVIGNVFESNGNDTSFQISCQAVDDDGFNNAFPLLSKDIVMAENIFRLTGNRKAIIARDGITGVQVVNNRLETLPSATLVNAVLLLCPNPIVTGNTWPGDVPAVYGLDGSSRLIVPDVCEDIGLNTTSDVEGIVTYSMSYVTSGGIAYLTPGAGGSGYTTNFAVTFTGGGGSGATATAFVFNGAVVGYRMTDYGAGYTSVPTAVLTAGSGTGAAATAVRGGALPNRRRLNIYFYSACLVKRDGTAGPRVDAATVRNIKVPASGMMGLSGLNNRWQVLSAAPHELFGSATYDPASLADGAGVTTTVTVTGAALGDYAQATFSNDLQGITLTAWVSATNTVSVRFQNESGGVLDLASGTLSAKVVKS